MIAVIADDFTGAAELAGISLRYGLKITICLGQVIAPDTDVLIVCTDTRSLSKPEAVEITKSIVADILKVKPDFIYKKIDSVLRGHVLEEIKAQMHVTGLARVLILPANPSLGRIISNGHYFINEKKIHETPFASDPEFPVKTSSVKQLVPGEGIKVLKHSEQLPLAGFVVGEAEEVRDTMAWANKVNDSWALAGAADFYSALLGKKYKWRRQEELPTKFPHLYVCGTAHEKNKKLIHRIQELHNCVLYINHQTIVTEPAGKKQWIENALQVLKKHNKAVVAFDDDIPDSISAKLLRTVMAGFTTSLVEQAAIKELFIEGGATAATIMNELKIKSVLPVHEYQPGVVRMQYGNMFITAKPGSYDMPKQIRDLYLK